jgi:hypothetical protein
MGYSPGAPVEVATPRLALDRHHALLVAQAAFAEWRSEQLSAPSDTRIEETAGGYEVTIVLDGLPILQVTVDRRTGQTTRTPLARWTALSRPGRK